jgi:Na+-driven multidrug efflux pump
MLFMLKFSIAVFIACFSVAVIVAYINTISTEIRRLRNSDPSDGLGAYSLAMTGIALVFAVFIGVLVAIQTVIGGGLK